MYVSVDGCAFWLPNNTAAMKEKKVEKPFILNHFKANSHRTDKLQQTS